MYTDPKILQPWHKEDLPRPGQRTATSTLTPLRLAIEHRHLDSCDEIALQTLHRERQRIAPGTVLGASAESIPEAALIGGFLSGLFLQATAAASIASSVH